MQYIDVRSLERREQGGGSVDDVSFTRERDVPERHPTRNSRAVAGWMLG